MNKSLFLFSLFIILGFSACTDYTPKPGGYPRIEKKGESLEQFIFPQFSFEFLGIITVQEEKRNIKDELWFNIFYPLYDATVYCTYIQVNDKTLSQALEESYRLVYNHAGKAEGISQTVYIDSLHAKYGIIYDVKGAVAAPIQFYITDDVSNFLRGSLYFNREVKIDSVAPVIQYVREDIVGLMESLKWK